MFFRISLAHQSTSIIFYYAYDFFLGSTYSCTGNPSKCPSSYDCAPSNVANISVCCRKKQKMTDTVAENVTKGVILQGATYGITFWPECPVGWITYKDEQTGAYKFCQSIQDTRLSFRKQIIVCKYSGDSARSF